MFLSGIIRNGGNHAKIIQNGGNLLKIAKGGKSMHHPAQPMMQPQRGHPAASRGRGSGKQCGAAVAHAGAAELASEEGK